MPFINSKAASAVEPQTQPEGVYDLVVKKADIHRGKESGKDSIRTIIGIEGVPNAADFFHYVPLVHEEDDEEKANNKLLMQKRFLAVFNIPFNDDGFNTDDFIGAAGRGYLKVEPDNNGIDRNVLQPGKKV